MKTLIRKINNLAISRSPFFLFVDFEMKEPVIIGPDDLEEESIFVSFPGFSNIPGLSARGAGCAINRIIPPGMECYKKGFDIVMKNLHYGNSFLTNYTCRTEIELTSSFRDAFANAHAKYKILFKDKWVCFSPETFVQIKDGMIYSFPMKGTINGEIPNAEQVILNDEKEIAEHYTIVDLIRNDLGMVASDVSVERFRYTEKVETYKGVLWQVSSEIRGRLPEKFHHNLGDILFALLPAGSVSGAPKAKTLDVIRQAENYQRGFYCGVVFYFDGENVDSCVLIRFIERLGDKYITKAVAALPFTVTYKRNIRRYWIKFMFPFIETIHVEHFEAHLLSEHLSRIRRTCKEVFGVGRDTDLIGADVLQISTETQEKTRLTVFYNEADHRFVSRIYTPKRVRQFHLAEANDLDYHLKYADRTRLESLKKHLIGEDEVIIIQNGEVTDTTFSNICFFQAGRWFTPARPLFEGIKRKFYLEKKQIAERRIKVEDIFHYEKICLINSMLDIHQSEYPIHSIRTE